MSPIYSWFRRDKSTKISGAEADIRVARPDSSLLPTAGAGRRLALSSGGAGVIPGLLATRRMSPMLYGRQSTSGSDGPSGPTNAYREQFRHPADVFSVLLLLGGDVVNRALAQLAGTGFTPVAFSFGWVAYGVSALVSCVGENRLMPVPDCSGLVINGEAGTIRENSSWILGRMIRDFHYWSPLATTTKLSNILDERHRDLLGNDANAKRPKHAGLCITVFEASDIHTAGIQPTLTWLSLSGIIVTLIQLGMAAIPCGVFGDWGILMITALGVTLSYLTGMLPQWHDEKWACRRNSGKTVVLTRGNGAQHAIVILGKGPALQEHGRGLDLEDLAAVAANVDVVASFTTRLMVGALAVFWVLLLITAAGTKTNTWFLVAVGAIGILQNAAAAGWQRQPKHFGVPLKFVEVIGHKKVMQALLLLEERYPHVGRSVRDIFFQGKMFPKELEQWKVLELEADWYEAARKTERATIAAARASDALILAKANQNSTTIRPNKEDLSQSSATTLTDVAREADAKVTKATAAANKAEAAVADARNALKVEHNLERTLNWAWKDPAVPSHEFYT